PPSLLQAWDGPATGSTLWSTKVAAISTVKRAGRWRARGMCWRSTANGASRCAGAARRRPQRAGIPTIRRSGTSPRTPPEEAPTFSHNSAWRLCKRKSLQCGRPSPGPRRGLAAVRFLAKRLRIQRGQQHKRRLRFLVSNSQTWTRAAWAFLRCLINVSGPRSPDVGGTSELRRRALARRVGQPAPDVDGTKFRWRMDVNAVASAG